MTRPRRAGWMRIPATGFLFTLPLQRTSSPIHAGIAPECCSNGTGPITWETCAFVYEVLGDSCSPISVRCICPDQIYNMFLHCGVRSKLCKPVDLRLSAKPRHLSLGIISVALLSRHNRLLK